MRKFLLVLFVLIVALFGCSNQNVSKNLKSGENDLKEEPRKEKEPQQKHDISSEDKKIIKSIKNKDYEHVIKKHGT